MIRFIPSLARRVSKDCKFSADVAFAGELTSGV